MFSSLGNENTLPSSFTMKANWSKVSLAFLLIVAIVGTMLRAAPFLKLPLLYPHLVHAHSHVAFQGWIYTLMFLFLIKLYLTDEQIKGGHYALQFKLTIVVILGVLVSFSLQGYALFSIICSTLFQLLNYWFIYRFLKDTKHLKSTISLKFIKTGLWLGVLSTLIPFGIGYLAAQEQSGSENYQALVYTFLHLQYNGWFLFVAIGLFFQFLEKQSLSINTVFALRFHQLFSIAIIPAITLSLLGMSFAKYIQPLAYASSGIQFIGFIFFALVIKNSYRQWLPSLPLWTKVFITLFLSAFILKIALQSLAIVPQLSDLVFHNKLIILAYLHLSLIGTISFLFIALLFHFQWLTANLTSKIGSCLFISGFVVTELVLVLGGLDYYYSNMTMLVGSGIMALGTVLLLVTRTSNREING